MREVKDLADLLPVGIHPDLAKRWLQRMGADLEESLNSRFYGEQATPAFLHAIRLTMEHVRSGLIREGWAGLSRVDAHVEFDDVMGILHLGWKIRPTLRHDDLSPHNPDLADDLYQGGDDEPG